MFTPSSSFNQPPEWTLLFTSYDISLCFRLAALAKQVFEPDYLMLDTMKDRYWSQHTDGLMFTVKVYTLTYRIFFSAGESLYFCKNIINI